MAASGFTTAPRIERPAWPRPASANCSLRSIRGDGERGRLDRSRLRPADGLTAPALAHQTVRESAARAVRRDAEHSDREGRAPLSDCIFPAKPGSSLFGVFQFFGFRLVSQPNHELG